MHQELGHRFCWITNLEIHNANTASTLSKKGRLRWKIENEGFNVQKNHGYALQHKFSRVSFQANYNILLGQSTGKSIVAQEHIGSNSKSF